MSPWQFVFLFLRQAIAHALCQTLLDAGDAKTHAVSGSSVLFVGKKTMQPVVTGTECGQSTEGPSGRERKLLTPHHA